MKSCFTTFSLQELTLRECIDLAVDKGLRGIELRGKSEVHISPCCSGSYIRDARRMLNDVGLETACVTGYMRFAQPDIAAERTQALEAARYAQLCMQLGAPAIRAFMGPWPEGVEKQRVTENAIAGLCMAAEAVRGSGVRLLIETHDSAKSGALLNPILAHVPDEVGVLLDIIHPYDMGEDIDDTLTLIGARIHHVHIKDISATVAGGRVYCRIGEGLLPVQKTVRALKAFGYDGYYCLEWEKSAAGTPGVAFDEQLDSFISLMKQEAAYETDL